MCVQVKKWAEVLQIISGKSQRTVSDPAGQYPIYGSGGIMGHANDFLCEAGSTIVGRKGTINRPIFVNERFWNVDTAFGLFPKQGLSPKYLFYFCQSFNFKALDKSTTIPSLAKRDLLNIEMPVPPLPEQQRIVSRIEELFSQLDASVAELKTAKERLKVYQQAVLKEAFRGITSIKPIKEVSEFVTSGSRGWAKYYAKTGARFIRITDLTRDKIALKNDNIQHVELPDVAEGKRSKLEPGDVLISITADLGSVALIPDGIGEAYINQHIAMIRFRNTIQSEYMAWYLKSDYGQKDLLKNKRGGGKLGLGLDDIRETPVPDVDNNVVIDTVSKISRQLSVCDSIEQTVDIALQQAEALRQSILKRAFEKSYE